MNLTTKPAFREINGVLDSDGIIDIELKRRNCCGDFGYGIVGDYSQANIPTGDYDMEGGFPIIGGGSNPGTEARRYPPHQPHLK